MEKYTLVTGASSGIGREIAVEMARRGKNLILVSRNLAKLEEVGEEIKSKNKVEVMVISCDLSKSSDVESACEKIKRHDVFVEELVNNAGFGDCGDFVSADWEKLSGMIRLNIEALTHLTWRLLPEMVRNGGGKILNVASTAAFFPGPYMAVYYATKAYVLSFSEALSEELLDTGVSVTCLCPGPTESGFQKRANMSGLRIVSGKMDTSTEVAKYAVAALESRKVIAVFGLKNKIQTKLPKVLPRATVRKLVAWIQRRENA